MERANEGWREMELTPATLIEKAISNYYQSNTLTVTTITWSRVQLTAMIKLKTKPTACEGIPRERWSGCQCRGK
jgi:hypothetical protein